MYRIKLIKLYKKWLTVPIKIVLFFMAKYLKINPEKNALVTFINPEYLWLKAKIVIEKSSINIFLGFRVFLPNTGNYGWAKKLEITAEFCIFAKT